MQQHASYPFPYPFLSLSLSLSLFCAARAHVTRRAHLALRPSVAAAAPHARNRRPQAVLHVQALQLPQGRAS